MRAATQKLLDSGILQEKGLEFVREAPAHRVILRDNFGEASISVYHILNGAAPGIKTALDKNAYIAAKFRGVHGDKYTYDKVEYRGSHTKVEIICPTHGSFYQNPTDHLGGKGCLSCANNSRGSTLRSNTADFTKKAREVHGDKYDYSKVAYLNRSTKVEITCKQHGSFWQTPGNHLRGNGCLICRKSTTEEFIEKAQAVHGDNYNYNKVEYQGIKTKVEIICPTHGSFWQEANSHLSGTGCPACAQQHIGWTHTKWETQGNASKHFDGFKLYVIKCWDDTTREQFYKIGKTFVTMGRRFQSKGQMPYQWRLLYSETGSARYISKLEHKLHARNYDNKYTPKREFAGMTECFSELKDAYE